MYTGKKSLMYILEAKTLPLPKSHRRCSPTCPAPLGCGPGKIAFYILWNCCLMIFMVWILFVQHILAVVLKQWEYQPIKLCSEEWLICGRVVWFYNDLFCEFMNPLTLPFLSLFIVKIIELFMLHEYSVWNCGACQVGLMVGDAETKLWRIWPGLE